LAVSPGLKPPALPVLRQSVGTFRPGTRKPGPVGTHSTSTGANLGRAEPSVFSRAVATRLFLANEEKGLVICIEQSVGAAIAMFMQGTQKGAAAHPGSACEHLAEAKIERVIINDLKRGTYFARPQCGKRIAREENHRDRFMAQRVYRDGDSANRANLCKPQRFGKCKLPSR